MLSARIGGSAVPVTVLDLHFGLPDLIAHLVMLPRLALANGHGWHRFLNSVNLVLPKRAETLDVPLGRGEPQEGE